ncbi:hypothetical protein CRG98_047082 [Punica granatum]|uniref:Uncharacterized protein n=1 Tax=Punica granatum TaxID=22663 RepID=A0A2I0HLH1_PUNGR|nr:hypothetical protein CRG98_047082 [Punica granatum]
MGIVKSIRKMVQNLARKDTIPPLKEILHDKGRHPKRKAISRPAGWAKMIWIELLCSWSEVISRVNTGPTADLCS